MALILCIETATKNCSVSLADNGKDICSESFYNGEYSHNEKLHLLVEKVLSKSGKNIKELDAVAVSKGPGSYTGLRIAVSAAKGFCFALDIPLISVSTLKIMAAESILKYPYAEIHIPMIDARRMEVYTAAFDKNLSYISKIEAKIIGENSFSEFKNKNIVFFGCGAEKCRDILIFPKENILFDTEMMPQAHFMANFAQQNYNLKEFEDVAYFEPYYLKDFLPGGGQVK